MQDLLHLSSASHNVRQLINIACMHIFNKTSEKLSKTLNLKKIKINTITVIQALTVICVTVRL